MSKIVHIKPVFRAGGMKLPDATITPFVTTYVSPAAIAAAAEVGARAYIRVVETATHFELASDAAFWAADRKINKLKKDPAHHVRLRGQFRVTDRTAGIWAGSPPCGQDEFFDAIPNGYQRPFLGGRDWLWPALVRLGWKAQTDAARKILRDEILFQRKTLGKSYPKETRDDARASIKTIKQLF